MKRIGTFILGLLLLVSIPIQSRSAAPVLVENWRVSQIGNELRIAYGSGVDFPQYAVLHLSDGYLRLNYGPVSGWGTSVILLPVFWSGGHLYQGAPVTVTYEVVSTTLVLHIQGTIGGLDVSIEVHLSPPVRNEMISAYVIARVEGDVMLDNNRPWEAFKPVMLSSMHISSTQWDTQAAYACLREASIPASDWILEPPAFVRLFGLEGGTSSWKTNAPTVEILLDQPRYATGWVTPSTDPNDDNVGFWAATDIVLHSWSYVVTVNADPRPRTNCVLVSKAADPRPVEAGEPLTYTLRVVNIAGVTLNTAITDTLPAQVTPSGVLTWSPAISPGQAFTQTVHVTVQGGYTGRLINRVQVSSEEGQGKTAQTTVCSNNCLYFLPIIFKILPNLGQ